ncbi:MAG: hypothetical protein B7Y84_14015, partial [Azorhizobium sp. 32-67-21]
SGAFVGLSFGGDDGGSGGDGGTVNATIGGGIETSGAGSNGLFVQSIGGGGGLAGDMASTVFDISHTSVGTGGGDGDGGAINVTVNGSIVSQGENAAAVNLQSIGGGGGAIQTSGVSGIGSAGGTGIGGAITLAVNGTISATGLNSPGIFAASLGGTGASNIAIAVNSGAVVSGGKGALGAGITLSGGADNSIGIAANAAVQGLGGVAILAGAANEIVQNAGTVTGSVDLGLGTNAFTNLAGGVFNAGDVVQLNGGTLSNAGTLSPSGLGKVGSSAVTGNLTSPGTLAIDVDLRRGRADSIAVSGAADLTGGAVAINAVGIAPNATATYISAATLTGAPVYTDNSLVYQWQQVAATTSGGQPAYGLTAQANFTPAGVGLNPNQQAIAAHLQSVWNAGGASGANQVFSGLGGTSATASAYQAALSDLSPELLGAGASTRTSESRAVMNRTMSCPVFAEGTMLVVEDQCAWARMIFGRTTQTSSAQNQGFTTDTITAQTGVQVQVAPDWFTAFSVAYQQAWTTGTGNSSWTSAYGLDVSAALKHQAGPWLFALAADFGWMNSSSSRTISGLAASPTSSSDTYNVTGRFRVVCGLRRFLCERPRLCGAGQ